MMQAECGKTLGLYICYGFYSTPFGSRILKPPFNLGLAQAPAQSSCRVDFSDLLTVVLLVPRIGMPFVLRPVFMGISFVLRPSVLMPAPIVVRPGDFRRMAAGVRARLAMRVVSRL